MKGIIMVIMLISSLFLFTGCWVYGQGQSKGVLYAIDDGIVWDKVFFKPSLQSTESDCYLLQDDNIKQELRNLPPNTEVQLNYRRHFFTVGQCPEGTGTDDEITSYKIINK